MLHSRHVWLVATCSVLLSAVACTYNSNITCPTWYVPTENGTDKCTCGDTVGIILQCLKDDQVGLIIGNCMTYTDDEQTLVGLCPYAVPTASLLDNLYTTLPKNLSALNQFMCGGLNRTGLLCSQCRDGLTLAAMSYHRKCIECSDSDVRKGIVLFLVLAFVPTTAFFLLVMVCSIDIASGPMNAVLTIVQVSLAEINPNPSDFIFRSSNPMSYYPVIFFLTFYGIWNLDFFRYILPPFCIHQTLSNLQAEALEYVIAVYPLLLIFATYICVELYDNKYRLIVILWEPFRRIFRSKCFKDLNVKYSLITSFATFLQLVYARIFFISKGILNYTYLTNSTGDSVGTVLAMDGSVTYFSSIHAPYVVIAFVMLFIFNLLPLVLLLLYPTRCFQHLLGCFPRVNWHPLRAFMDIFHGCYKNGTEGTRDYRYFAGLNLIIRILLILNHSVSSIRMVLVPLVFSYMIASFRPYQRNILNYWDTFCFFLYSMNMLWVLSSIYSTHLSSVLYVTNVIMFLYFCFLISAKVLKTLLPSCYAKCVERARLFVDRVSKRDICCCCCCCCQLEGRVVDVERGSLVTDSCAMDNEFPDRINNPQDYPPLLAAQSAKISAGSLKIASYGINDS